MTLPDFTAPRWRRRFRLLGALALVVIALFVIWKLLTVLLPFLVSGIVAYLAMPLVDALARYTPGRRRWPRLARALAAGLVSLAVIAIVLGAIALAVVEVLYQSLALAGYAPVLLTEVQEIWAELQAWYRQRVPDSVRSLIDPRLSDVQNALLTTALDTLERIVAFARGGLSLFISLAAVPLILFYLLYDPNTLGRGVLRLTPPPVRHDLAAIWRLGGAAIGSYIRVQLLMALLVGSVIGVSLWLLDVPRAVILAVIAGLAELLPVVGATISLVAASVITLLSDPSKVLIVIALYLVVQTLQNVLLSPRLQSQALNLHPLAIVLALTVAGAFFSFWGVLAAAPITAAGYRVLGYAVTEWHAAARQDDAGQKDNAAQPEPGVDD